MNGISDTREQARHGVIATCRCGQDLDCCSHSHCPRCGTTLRVETLVLAA